jgi:regulator of RNase E activity RraA
MSLSLTELFSGMFSDELDRMGYPNQIIGGLNLNRFSLKCLGPARTVLIETVEMPDENISMGLGFLESLNSGDILCVAGSSEFAYFGELMSRLSIRQGLTGVVIGGLTRDSSFTQHLEQLPIFAEGYTPKDIKGRGRVAAVDVPIQIREVEIKPNDWIFGDSDGVVVIPAPTRHELLDRIQQLIKDEADIVARLERGESITSILQYHKAF